MAERLSVLFYPCALDEVPLVRFEIDRFALPWLKPPCCRQPNAFHPRPHGETMSPEQEILALARVVAVVGLSTEPRKDSHIVARHVQRSGLRVVPVHPSAAEILGEKAYPSLAAIPDGLREQVDLVDVFRPAAEAPRIVQDALAALPALKGVWLQKGLVSQDAARLARERGLLYVEDRCLRTQLLYRRFAA